MQTYCGSSTYMLYLKALRKCVYALKEIMDGNFEK